MGPVLNDARLGALVVWDSIEDRGRVPVMPPHWNGAAELSRAAAAQFRINRWGGQPFAVEVWSEKDALSSVLEPVYHRYHVRFLANRGYSSATAM